ncbi:LytR/AlgR family response regulator transcription factor [Marinoscillum furvescens]|uniref:LytTR family two component transcriptional regulator n=1 Tax=Marinoscillum furvescens DSM 4134 TaxID=1122208 RepID=A0A3D9L0Z2_MARFU|nr:LytTR family DNA-binding domain-containing protein [Marinoscillum furvescens]RED97425.1 LytTR family two component transcriptional regulator [Marinoscillum furvescens DSM 4134]
MGKYTCIAIDDDIVALKIISSLIEKTPFLDLVGTYQNSVKGASAILEDKPDIVFLDIQMPDLSGMDILKSLNEKPQIILVTSQDGFAVEAFEFDVVDYLLKPIENYGRFLKAANKAVSGIEEKSGGKGDAQNLFVKSDSLLVNLDTSDIHYVEAYGDYIKIHTPEKTHVVYGKLKDTEAKLPDKDFIRVHRSYIVRIDKIKNIDQGNLQIGEKIIPVSSSYRGTLLERIKTL